METVHWCGVIQPTVRCPHYANTSVCPSSTEGECRTCIKDMMLLSFSQVLPIKLQTKTRFFLPEYKKKSHLFKL